MQPDELENLVKKEQELLYRSKAEEYQPDKRKLIEERGKILKKIEEIRTKRDAEKKKLEEEWRDKAFKENLCDFRYAHGTNVDHVLHGILTLELLEWLKLEGMEFEIIGVSGHKLKIDLRKLITPSLLRMLLGKPLAPIYFVVEAGGGYDRHGKKLGVWQSGDWEQSHGNEIRAGTTFAIMRV